MRKDCLLIISEFLCFLGEIKIYLSFYLSFSNKNTKVFLEQRSSQYFCTSYQCVFRKQANGKESTIQGQIDKTNGRWASTMWCQCDLENLVKIKDCKR